MSQDAPPTRLADDRSASRTVSSSSLRLLDAKAAGEILSVPSTWLLAQARRNAVPHVKLGKYVRFDPADLERWIESAKRGPK